MQLFGPGYSGPSKVSYFFVDAAALRGYMQNISKRFFGDRRFSFDLNRMKSGYTRLFYYDAMPVRTVGEREDDYLVRTAAQRATFEDAAAVDGVHVYEGDAHKRKNRGAGGLEQKKVDVMIAVDMLTHTFRRNMHDAALLTGDNDFKPLIDALVREGMFVTLFYPPGETNVELVNAADARRRIDYQLLFNWMTDESRDHFILPTCENKSPELESGVLITEWTDNQVRCVLRKDDDLYVVLRDGDASNRLNISHTNYDLLTAFCRSKGYNVPELPVA